MNLPNQSAPVYRGTTGAKSEGIKPSGDNTQCCGTNCMTTYCFLGLSSKGCHGNNPYINCIGG